MNKPKMRQLDNGHWHCKWGEYNCIMPTWDGAYRGLIEFCMQFTDGFRP